MLPTEQASPVLWDALPHYRPPAEPPSIAEAQAWCRRLAQEHYENFSVATWFLPRRLRPHFYSIYAYCRVSDDLGDEVADKQHALHLLDAWEAELDAAYQGQPRHPVFVALAETIRACNIPKQPFADLLKAFRQDQFVSRYQTFDDLLRYCAFSANPVGRLVLYVCGYRDPQRQQLSDHTCTALQLANFWQDVALDHAKGRIYLPLEDLQRFRVSIDDIAQRRATDAFRDLMRFEVARARDWFERGLPLAAQVDPELALDVELFTRGGQAILDAVERQEYDVLTRRPTLSKPRKLALVAGAALRRVNA